MSSARPSSEVEITAFSAAQILARLNSRTIPTISEDNPNRPALRIAVRALKRNADIHCFKREVQQYRYLIEQSRLKDSSESKLSLSEEHKFKIAKAWIHAITLRENVRSKNSFYLAVILSQWVYELIKTVNDENKLRLKKLYLKRGQLFARAPWCPLDKEQKEITELLNISDEDILTHRKNIHPDAISYNPEPEVSETLLAEIAEKNDYEKLQYLIYRHFSIFGRCSYNQNPEYAPLVELNKIYHRTDVPIQPIVELFKKSIKLEKPIITDSEAPARPNPCTSYFTRKGDQFVFIEDSSEQKSSSLQYQTLVQTLFGAPLLYYYLPKSKISDNQTWLDKIKHPNYEEKMKMIRKTNEDKVMPIIHGGGYFHLLEFLSGKSRGYRADGRVNFVGLFVSPGLIAGDNSRENMYANRKPIEFFDQPCVMKANIQTKLLTAVPNYYEAFIEYPHADKIEDIQLRKLGI